MSESPRLRIAGWSTRRPENLMELMDYVESQWDATTGQWQQKPVPAKQLGKPGRTYVLDPGESELNAKLLQALQRNQMFWALTGGPKHIEGPVTLTIKAPRPIPKVPEPPRGRPQPKGKAKGKVR